MNNLVMQNTTVKNDCGLPVEEEICTMASECSKLDCVDLPTVHQNLLHIASVERTMRREILNVGVTVSVREMFETLPLSRRQCSVCRKICFLSALKCNYCSSDKIVCLQHCLKLCKCTANNYVLLFRYNLDELLLMLKDLKLRMETYDAWCKQVKNILGKEEFKTASIADLKSLVQTACENNFLKSDLYDLLLNALKNAEKCVTVINELDLRKDSENKFSSRYKLSFQKLRIFMEEINSLVCPVEGVDVFQELWQCTMQFGLECSILHKLPLNKCSLVDFENTYNLGKSLCIDLPSLHYISKRIIQIRWLQNAIEITKQQKTVDLNNLQSLVQTGYHLPSDEFIKKEIKILEKLRNEANSWEKLALMFIEKKSKTLQELEKILVEGENIQINSPSKAVLGKIMDQINEWLKQFQIIVSSGQNIYYDMLKDLYLKGKVIPVMLPEINCLATELDEADKWKTQLTSVFLNEGVNVHVLDAILPCRTFSVSGDKSNQNPLDTLKELNSTNVHLFLSELITTEVESIKKLRLNNSAKNFKNDTFCICKKAPFGLMMRCELCKDWFHSSCVPLPDAVLTHSTVSDMGLNKKDCKFLCCNCYKTKRPDLKAVLKLLNATPKFHIHLLEKYVIECLIELIISWKNKVQCLFEKDEIKNIRASSSSKYTIDIFKEREYENIYRKKSVSSKSFEHLQMLREYGNRIEELFIEGNLFEITLEETYELWKLLQIPVDNKNDLVDLI